MLGPIEVIGNDGTKRLRGQQAILLAHLAAAHPAPASFGELETAFWGEQPPVQVDNAMRVAVTRLRNRLDSGAIEHTTTGYRLADSVRVDLRDFRRHLDSARTHADNGDLDSALAATTQARALWRGPPFATVSDSISLRATIAEIEEQHATLEELRVDIQLASGRWEAAAAESSRLTSDHPLRERRWEQLMLALHLSGRASEAMRVFQQYRRMLADEVGLEPGTSIRNLESSLVSGDTPHAWFSYLAAPDPVAEPHAETTRLRRSPALPITSSSFVPRAALLEALDAAVGAHRLVTVAGPAGVGKTRLVRHFVNGLATGSTWWVDLRFEGATSVADAIADAFGAQTFDPAHLRHQLGAEPTIVLDNCDAFVSAAAEAATQLVALRDDVRVLATSRSPLGANGESVVRATPMSNDEAVRLLRARTDHGVHVPLDVADRIVEAIDRLPLAVELAATRLRTHTVGEMLAGNAHSADGIDLGDSLASLRPGERALFETLGVMTGTFDVPTAAAIASQTATDTRVLLDRLVVASLIELTPSGLDARYRLLEPIRETALELAERSGDAQRARQAHLDHYAGVVVKGRSDLMGPDEETAVRSLEESAPQVRAAWRHALATGGAARAAELAYGWWTMALRGLRHRDFDWPETASTLAGFDECHTRWEVHAAASMAEWARNRIGRSIAHGEAALDGAANTGTPNPLDARFGLIASYGFRDRHEDAHLQLVGLIDDARQQGDHYRLSGGQAQIAFGFSLVGMAAEARGQADAALDSAELSANTSALAFAHHASALVWAEDDPAAAWAHATEGARLAERADNRWLAGWNAATITALHRRAGRFDAAADGLRELLGHWRTVKMEPQLMHTVLESALLFDATGDTTGTSLAVSIANPGRTTHPLFPSDQATAKHLRAEVERPLPDDEAEALDLLAEHLTRSAKT